MSQYLNLEERLYVGTGKWDIPEIAPVYELPDIREWIGFNYARSTPKKKSRLGVQFFLDDYQFDRVWNQPSTNLKVLSKFGCVLSPDWSMYTNFPKAVQLFNHYRKHWVAKYWQEHGLTVIPTIGWSDEDSFEWCFDGEPKHSIVALSNVGCMKDKDATEAFNRGYAEMLRRLEPKEVLFFAHKFDAYEGPVTFIRWYLNKDIPSLVSA